MDRYSPDLPFLLDIILWGCKHEQKSSEIRVWQMFQKHNFTSDPLFALSTTFHSYSHLKWSPCWTIHSSLRFILYFLSFFSSVHVFSASIIVFPLRVINRSSVLSLSYFLPLSLHPRVTALYAAAAIARTHIFFPSDPVSMYSLGVHLHTTHYVTSLLLTPLSFPLSFWLPPTMSPEKNIQPRFLMTSCWVTQLL